jgi:hypothetical protein
MTRSGGHLTSSPADKTGYAGFGHQVSLIGRINESPSPRLLNPPIFSLFDHHSTFAQVFLLGQAAIMPAAALP